ncbi:hypothetical protein SAMN02949497_3773 [Methylomagnum ishizawai]|uniref:Uncharacterized protein n=1 Tax=Methylomagnum ishizawai TaxID=1760988 RepID=A0A1Y6D148_9GAMM|nr:hypothetical protein [Methylomagnum ishizawai]SMF96377.1 hypothetical protein SAMN02949497_3773 [Methylomagnum ishizawai]
MTEAETKLEAGSILLKALLEPAWPELQIKRGARLSRETLDALHAHRHIAEVQGFLERLEVSGYRINSRLWHYFRYKYLFGDSLLSPAELDSRFERVLRDGAAEIHRRGGQRYVVISHMEKRLAIVDATGLRISVYHYTEQDLTLYGEPSWQLRELIT